MQHGLCELESPDHASGVRPDQMVGRRLEIHERQRLPDPPSTLGPRDTVQLGRQGQILPPCEPAVGGHELRHVADAAPHVGGLPNDVVAGHHTGARARGEEGREHLDRRTLAGAVGAEQSEDRAMLDLEGEVLHGGERAEGAGQGTRLDCR